MTPKSGAIDGRVDELLTGPAVPAHLKRSGVRRYRADLERIIASDYEAAVRGALSKPRLAKLIASAKRLWPLINRETMRIGPGWPRRTSVAHRLGFQLIESPRPDVISIRGFYAPADGVVLRQPMIYLNTAHHPLANATAFCHEVGHHLNSMTEPPRGNAASYYEWSYESHLDDPFELAADVLVSVGAYPLPVAKKMFAGDTPASPLGAAARGRSLPRAVIRHLRDNYRFSLSVTRLAPFAACYLSGLIHYARLRAALLTQFDI